MDSNRYHKRKIINDPVYGFINVSFETILNLIEHPYFQRLRRIKQLGLTYFVYPGAVHSRFQHALGCTHLTSLAIEILRSKGHLVNEQEAESVTQAVLLHDIGHGPFSHALEESITTETDHEELSLHLMQELNNQSGGKLDAAIAIFQNRYPKRFLHQLVAGQLDMDRLDYLRRDSFYTGVSEGVIGSDRIIKMLSIVNDQLVVEAKGIYSIERFLIARRLMFWQVYLHKAVISAEKLLVNILRRARELAERKEELFATPALGYFLHRKISAGQFGKKELELFTLLDDTDIMASVKVWSLHTDPVLSMLCKNLLSRNLYRTEISYQPFAMDRVEYLHKKTVRKYGISGEDVRYFVFTGEITNKAYSELDDRIQILCGDGSIEDIAEASDMLNIQVLSKTVKKHFLCYPRELILSL